MTPISWSHVPLTDTSLAFDRQPSGPGQHYPSATYMYLNGVFSIVCDVNFVLNSLSYISIAKNKGKIKFEQRIKLNHNICGVLVAIKAAIHAAFADF